MWACGRRQGIASALVRHVCEAARAGGYERATLQNGHGLIAFYERLGFRVVSTLQHWQRAAEERTPTRAERARLRAGPDHLLLEAFLHHLFCGEREPALALLRERPTLAQLRQTNGATALHVVSFHGEALLARELLAAGADLEARDQDFGATPLIHAVVGGDECLGRNGRTAGASDAAGRCAGGAGSDGLGATVLAARALIEGEAIPQFFQQ